MDYLHLPFFERDIHIVAQDLLGRDLEHEHAGVLRRGRIVEVEVYEGANDRASHARSGKPTERTAPMFAAPGTIYVYRIYGRYLCLNIRAPSTDGPGAILVRACAPLVGLAAMAAGRGLVDHPQEFDESMVGRLMSGPAKLTQALGISAAMSGELVGERLWVRQGEPVAEILATTRLGLNRATCGPCVDRPWRYVVRGSPWLSAP